MSRERPVSDL